MSPTQSQRREIVSRGTTDDPSRGQRREVVTRETIDDTDSEPGTPVHVTVSLGISGDADSDPLAVISGINEGVKSMDGPLREAVARARQLRFTWEEIGEALGVTRQSAWERFSLD